MDKTIKNSLIAVGAIIILLTTFTLGVYASNNWLNFEGDTQVASTSGDIDEIVDLLRDSDTSRRDLADKLEGANSSYQELVDKVDELHHVIHEKDQQIIKEQNKVAELQDELQKSESRNAENKEYIKHLESELGRANKVTSELQEHSSEKLEEARDIVK